MVSALISTSTIHEGRTAAWLVHSREGTHLWHLDKAVLIPFHPALTMLPIISFMVLIPHLYLQSEVAPIFTISISKSSLLKQLLLSQEHLIVLGAIPKG